MDNPYTLFIVCCVGWGSMLVTDVPAQPLGEFESTEQQGQVVEPTLRVPAEKIRPVKGPDLTVSNFKIIAGPTTKLPLPVPANLFKGYWYVQVQFHLNNAGNVDADASLGGVFGRFRTTTGRVSRLGFVDFNAMQPVATGSSLSGASSVPPGGPLVLAHPLRPGDVAVCDGWLALDVKGPDRLLVWVSADLREVLQETREDNNDSLPLALSIP